MKKCVYTINFGGYDTLKEPTHITMDWDYICFSDREIESEIWDVKVIKTQMKSKYKAREVYIQSQHYVKDYDFSIMVGGQIRVDGNMNEFVKEYVDLSKDINLMKHPCRTCIYQEAEIIKRLEIDLPENVDPQMERYKKEGFPANYGLSACGIITRKKNDAVFWFETFWWTQVALSIDGNASFRDQLSFDYVRWKQGDKIKINWFPYDVLFGKYFSVYSRGSGNRIGGV